MINLSNETDYKLIFKTKNLYNFFFVLIITLFVGVFLKIINLSIQEKNNEINIVSEKISKKFLPTIFDTNGNRLAYSDFNFSIFKVNKKFEYLERVVVNDRKMVEREIIYEPGSRVRDVEIDPIGNIYVALENPGRIVKLSSLK